MDGAEEHISHQEMLESISELEDSQGHLMELNHQMRQRLADANEDITALRSENTSLKKQLKCLEQINYEEKLAEAEPCGSLLAIILNDNKNERMIQDLERESMILKDEKKKLNAKITFLEEERNKDKMCLNKLMIEYQSLEVGLEEAELALQRRDEFLNEKNLQMKHLEETVEEYSDTIKDLRLMKQELSEQLENRQDEASLAVLPEEGKEEDQPLSPPLSLAEEFQLLVSGDGKTGFIDIPALAPERDENTQAELLSETLRLSTDSRTKRVKRKASSSPSPRPKKRKKDEAFRNWVWMVSMETCEATFKNSLHRVGQLILELFFLVLMLVGCFAGIFSLLQPYLRFHYIAPPPF